LHRKALFDLEDYFALGFKGGHGFGKGLVAGIGFVGGDARVGRADLDARTLYDFQAKNIVQGDGLIDSAELMKCGADTSVRVGASGPDAEAEVDLRERADSDSHRWMI